MGEAAAGGFTQAGSIVRLKFTNFMQYSDTEFLAGPNLNVIIGPNGSGKSTIVNGICLGLAGKTSVLGRATSLAEFIKLGEQEAAVEVELFVPDEENVVISRRWNQENKSQWAVRGRKTTQKEVEKVVAHFRIQVDNLCQFLPQDKVHDFSRQNSRGLLDSTVDAVGDAELKTKHQELKEMQKTIGEGEDLHDRKKQMLKDKKERCERLEEEVKAFEEKKKIEEKIRLLEGRLAWSKVNEVKKEAKAKKETKENLEKQLNKEEKKLDPLKAALKEAEQKKKGTEAKIVADNAKVKESRAKAQTHSKNIEANEKQIKDLDDQLEEVGNREEEKKAHVVKLKTTIAQLEAESDSREGEGDAVGMEELEAAKRAARQAADAVMDQQQDKETVQHGLRGIATRKDGLKRELDNLRNVDTQKLQILKAQNDDAYKCCLWLRDHRDQFQGDVFEPFIVCGNVTDPANAMFVEASVNQRDLTAFFFTDKDDMNKFMRITRQEKGWKKVSAVQVPPQAASDFQPSVPADRLANLGLKSYLKEMVAAPDGVLAFLCKNHAIHKVAVFRAEAEKHNDQFVNEFQLTKFFLGSKFQTVSGSRYNSAKTTTTRTAQPMNLLSVSLDTDRSRRLEEEVAGLGREEQELGARLQQADANLKQLNMQLEAARKEQKALDQKKYFRAKTLARLDVERKKLRQLMATASLEGEREELRRSVKPAVRQMARSVALLQAAIREVDQGGRAMELARLANRPMDELVEGRQAAVEAAQEGLKELREGVKGATRELEGSKQELRAALREAREATGSGGNEAPQELAARWAEQGLPGQKEAIEVMVAELQNEADSMEAVDKRIVKDYRELQEMVRELEQDIERREQQQRDVVERMEQVKASWLAGLDLLITRISTRFSAHFASMGFAGQVLLDRGAGDENDFAMYGVDILVKYRDREPLQKLTAHHQSGGERSVATALYMLALQELTTVPFRCVDEINQGMDATNERRVFELLVRTSCHETSAQYFLLTPKLLAGLDYSPRMNVLIVNNGPGMLHHSQWDMAKFHRLAARA